MNHLSVVGVDKLSGVEHGRTSRVRPNEIRALTGLRGVAAIWVMVLHTEYSLRPWNHVRVVIDHGYLAVDLFFVLSGYVMALNYGNLVHGRYSARSHISFLAKRFARTYPLYSTATVVTAVLGFYGIVGLAIDPGTTCDRTALIPNLLLFQSWGTPFCSLDPPGWSISTEWGAYLVFPFLCRATLAGTRHRAVAASALAAVALLGLSFLSTRWIGENGWRFGPLNISNGATIAPGLRCLAGFTLGLVSFRFARSRAGNAIASNPAWSGVAALAIAIMLFFRGTDLFVVLTFPVLVVSLSSDRGFVSAVLGCSVAFLLGEISYSVYLVHYPIFIAVSHAMSSWPHGYREYAIDLATWGSALMVALLTFRLIERPARRALNNVFNFEGARRTPDRIACPEPITHSGASVSTRDE